MKAKRIFSGLLSVALIFGTLTIPAFAEESANLDAAIETVEEVSSEAVDTLIEEPTDNVKIKTENVEDVKSANEEVLEETPLETRADDEVSNKEDAFAGLMEGDAQDLTAGTEEELQEAVHTIASGSEESYMITLTEDITVTTSLKFERGNVTLDLATHSLTLILMIAVLQITIGFSYPERERFLR